MGTQPRVGESLRRLIQPEVDGASVSTWTGMARDGRSSFCSDRRRRLPDGASSLGAGRQSSRSEPRRARRVIRENPAIPRATPAPYLRSAEFSAENFVARSTAVRRDWHPAGWRTILWACSAGPCGAGLRVASLACSCDGGSVVCGGAVEVTDSAWRNSASTSDWMGVAHDECSSSWQCPSASPTRTCAVSAPALGISRWVVVAQRALDGMAVSGARGSRLGDFPQKIRRRSGRGRAAVGLRLGSG